MAKNSNKSKNLEKATPTYNVGAASKSRIAKENEKKKNKGFGIALFFLLLVIIGVSIGILFSPMFNLTKVIVKDGVNVSSGEILNAIDVSYGENILKQKFKAIKHNVLNIPYIKDVTLRLLLPDKIEIKYDERDPYMLISYLESYLIVDKHGFLLEIKKENDLEALPIIYGIELDNYELGESLDDTAKIKYKNIVALIETARQREFPYNIYEINYESINEVKFWVEGLDIDIIYGNIDKNLISDKLNYVSEVLKKISNKKGELDISSDNYLEKTIFTERHNNI